MARRFRCNACGNLTRFDVLTDRRTQAFYHYTVGGELEIEEEEVISEDVLEAKCRWCGHGNAVEEITPEDVAISADEMAISADEVADVGRSA